MAQRIPLSIQPTWAQYLPYALMSLATLAVGLVFGILAVGVLTVTEKAQLLTQIHQFITLAHGRGSWGGLFQPALMENLKAMGLLYILGVSVVGMPFVLVLLFFRGFVVGFSAGFLIGSLNWQGVGLTFATVAAQNLLILPALVIAGALALAFSWNLIFPRAQGPSRNIPEAFALYTLVLAILCGVIVAATAVEVYVGPWLLQWFG